MTLVLTSEWGPYLDVSDARTRLCSFVDRACDPLVGVVWATPDKLYPLRAPGRSSGGLRDWAVFHLGSNPPPPPAPPSGIWSKTKAFVEDALAEEGKAEIARSQSQMALGSAVNDLFKQALTSHRDDGANVALDIICVALSLALIPTGLEVVGIIALIAGTFLLGTDSAAYALELAGDDKGAETLKKATEKWRILATVLTLPDGLVGGWRSLRDISEIRDALALDRTTASAADRLAVRTSNATRASQYQQIAERAHLRSQLRTQQLRAALKLEITPRGAGLGSAGLLVREEWLNNESMLHSFLQRLQVHVSTVRS